MTFSILLKIREYKDILKNKCFLIIILQENDGNLKMTLVFVTLIYIVCYIQNTANAIKNEESKSIL